MKTSTILKGFLTLVLVFGISVISELSAQTLTVKGSVVDNTGEPLIGATVLELGSNNGVVTDIDGNYSIVVKNSAATLEFSNVGFMTVSETILSRTMINVTLQPDAINMSEVVVTGYGRTVSRDKLTAAISKVPTEALESGVHANALSALSGSVTGVLVTTLSGQPGQSPNIVIRGGAALDGSGTPLYVIDGIQKSDMSDVNSNDIESIEILKDAAATALYGARANAGVVLITTKSGKAGKTEVTFKMNYGINTMRHVNDFLEADDYLYYLRMAAYRSGQEALLTAAGPFGTGNDYYADGNASSTGIYSTMILSDWNSFLLDEGWKTMTDPIYGDELIYSEFTASDGSVREVSTTQDYNVSMSGGNDRGKYYASVGYYTEDGFPIFSYYDRLSFAFNGSYKIKDWLTASSSLNFSRSDSNEISDYRNDAEFFGIMFSAPPTMREYNLDGELIACTTNYQNGNWSATADKLYRRDTDYKFTMNQGLKIDFTKHLDLKLNAMMYFDLGEYESFNQAFVSSAGTTNTTRSASANYTRMLSQTYNAILGYNNTWNYHTVSAIGGFEYYDEYNFGLYASGSGADSDDFIGLQYTEIDPDTSSMSTTHTQERMMSGFVNASYDYDSRYLFSFSGRYDGYSKLVNNRWGFFPGVSAAWNMHREDFMEETSDYLTSLKIRAGYGQNGNVNIASGPYDLQGSYGMTANYNGSYGILIDDLPYPDLRWERTTSMDLAVEATFYNRLSLSLGVYNKLTSDLLATVPFPSSSGVSNQYTNNGSVRNRGIEFEVSYAFVQSKDWDVKAGFNATYMRSKVISLPENENENNRQGGQQVYDPNTGELIWVAGYQEGQEYGDLYGYQMLDVVRDNDELNAKYGWYVDETPSKGTIYGPEVWATLTAEEQASGMLLQPGDAIYQDVNGDNIVDSYDQVYMGNSVPNLVGGFNVSARYKNLSLYARFDYAAGYTTYNDRKRWYLACGQGTFNTLTEIKDSWTENNLDAEYPVFMYADTSNRNNYRYYSSMYYDNSSYICARDISISYQFPKAWANAAMMENLSLSISGQNLFYITNSSLFSPEYGANNLGGYSLPRTVVFGVTATF
ncbi:MAG: TonB-dependent receptor [Rikenellaceae bacterium]